MIGRTRIRVATRIDEPERAAGPEPASADGEELVEPITRDVADPEAAEQSVDLTVGFVPGVAELELRGQTSGGEALPADAQRLVDGVVRVQLAAWREACRPPACTRRELNDVAVDRQRIDERGRFAQLHCPRFVLVGTVAIAALAQIPVVVFGRT